ncbi:MAG: hypothetical protein II992_12235 [Lachnospiraceae bacterium]|nr:hypothetical protein [Lachnospiraceae bacterium]MBQ3164677.1 hypothetical protein [Lachnospiraceae bacterium]MBQ3601950.1 hypothetical protein [Lachnospiraceae bacterium]
MILIRSRLGFVVASLAVAFICWAVVYLPPYEKIVYENSPILSQEEANEKSTMAKGYKGDENIKRVNCIDDLRNEKGIISVILEIDSNDLEATGIYQCIEEGESSKPEYNKIKVLFYRTIKSYGQYYIATLESGERFAIFINDNVVDVKRKGIIQLPIGRKNMITSIDFVKYNVQYPYEHSYLDCASGFATGPEMQDFRFMEKMAVLGIIVVMVVFLGIVLGINIGNSRK